mmetsp:Transcript_169038/g.410845  ORF Transcript_169038/g.410845 Transcript_169038/m.410845 type:complete len:367 (-) Transcript_169038:101-1201(-)
MTQPMLSLWLAGLLSTGVARGLRLEARAGASAADDVLGGGCSTSSTVESEDYIPAYMTMAPVPWHKLRTLVPALESGEYLTRPIPELSPGEGLASEPVPEYNNISRLDYLYTHCHGRERQGAADPWACGPENRWKEISIAVKLASDAELAGALQACRSEEKGRPCWSHSQWAEDAALYSMFFRGHHGGSFVELGALDGLRFSNSLFFEETLGWRGVLIEPSPGQFQMLRQNRNASGNAAFHNAACREERELHFKDCGATGHVEARGRQADSTDVVVKCRPLGKMLREAGVQVVDLLSLDVEGFEWEVLQSYDWGVPLHVLLVERHIEQLEMERLLRGKGFRYVRELMGSHVFVNSTWQGLASHRQR